MQECKYCQDCCFVYEAVKECTKTGKIPKGSTAIVKYTLFMTYCPIPDLSIYYTDSNTCRINAHMAGYAAGEWYVAYIYIGKCFPNQF